MPIDYKRDDDRQLITVTLTEPHSVDDILSAIDRQAAEGTWGYAMLYDSRALTHTSNESELRQIAARVKAAGAGRERGPVGMAIGARPAVFLVGLMYAQLVREVVSVEVLLTEAQIAAWLTRNVRAGPPPQP
jgi:hypothetical protein